MNLFESFDTEKLFLQRREIIEAIDQNAMLHQRVSRYLSAAGAVLGDLYRLAQPATNHAKIESCAARIARRRFRPQKTAATERFRLLSAVTAEGVTFFRNSVLEHYKDITVIEDDYGSVTRVFLRKIREEALQNGYDIVTCYCSISPYEKIEHILIPAIGAAFVTSNRYHRFQCEGATIIRSRRFVDSELLRDKKCRINFSRKIAGELLSEASAIIRAAKENHDEIEAIYGGAIDFHVVDSIGEDLWREISADIGQDS